MNLGVNNLTDKLVLGCLPRIDVLLITRIVRFQPVMTETVDKLETFDDLPDEARSGQVELLLVPGPADHELLPVLGRVVDLG